MPELPLIEEDDDLVPLLRRASNEMLEPLVAYITDDGKGRVSSQLEILEVYKRHQPHRNAYADEIAAEIQKFGGNTVANVARGGKGVRYQELARDVAGKLGVKTGKKAPVAVVEQQVLLKVIEKAWERMSESERRELLTTVGVDASGTLPAVLPVLLVQAAIRASGFMAYKLALIVANAVARAVLGRGLSLAANVALVRGIAVFAGPIGWAVTALWTAVDLAGPAYRVTVPCVIQVTTIRLAEAEAASVAVCPAGHANPRTARFCNECGAALDDA